MRMGRRVDIAAQRTTREKDVSPTDTLPAQRAIRLYYEYTSRTRRVGRFERRSRGLPDSAARGGSGNRL